MLIRTNPKLLYNEVTFTSHQRGVHLHSPYPPPPPKSATVNFILFFSGESLNNTPPLDACILEGLTLIADQCWQERVTWETTQL